MSQLALWLIGSFASAGWGTCEEFTSENGNYYYVEISLKCKKMKLMKIPYRNYEFDDEV
jgi:hypothetical protein